MSEYIVGEISKNWRDGEPVTPDSGIVAEQFERMINTNLARGYRLVSFAITSTMVDKDLLNETLIAVFQRLPSATMSAEEARNAGT